VVAGSPLQHTWSLAIEEQFYLVWPLVLLLLLRLARRSWRRVGVALAVALGLALDEWIRVRKLDNTHFCAEQAARYTEALLTDMTALFKLAPAQPNWEQGSWNFDSNNNTPSGSCPDDHHQSCPSRKP
jgi:peptidoglycan/LPS O-acetylase OafA/YrhL